MELGNRRKGRMAEGERSSTTHPTADLKGAFLETEKRTDDVTIDTKTVLGNMRIY